ncbi:MAG: cadherin-like domain-containing protein, partial [Candidatus Accumulibacter sp.]|nr:cadherin-like domain-containing protein [Accumulibacter sp.]
TNVAPTVPVSGNASVDEGSVYTLNVGAVVDPGVDTPTLYRINWGDGSPTTDFTPTQYADLLLAGGNVSHTYADGGAAGTPRNIVVQVLDEDGTHNAGSLLVTVNNVAPTIALGGGASVDEGATYTLTLGAVSDPGVDSVTSYVVHWGDGTSDTYGAAGDVTHVYADGLSSPTITVDLVDEDGTHTNAGSKSVTVNNVAPTIALTGAASVDEGATYTLNLGAVTDPGSDSVSSYVVNWGDGTSDTYASAGDVTHVYADGDANRTISVDLVDEDGTHLAAGTLAVSVNNVAPTIALAGASNVIEDTVYTLTLGAVTDPGNDTVTSYVVDWGDGTTDTHNSAGDVTHTYANPGNYAISVELVDEDGNHSNAGGKAVTVNAAGGGNTDPVADDESYSVHAGQTLTIAAPGVLDGDTDADGDPLSVLSVNVTGLQGILAQQLDGSFSFTPNAGFTGTTSFGYTVSDGFGGTDTGTVSIDVSNTDPVADDETYTMRPGQTLNIAEPGVLDGDADADGDPLSVTSVNVTGLQGSVVQQLDGSFSFTPNAGFTGQTSFSYTVSDGFGGFDTGTVSIDVSNTAPVADDESYSVHAGQTLDIATPGVLDGDTDADGDPLSVTSVNVTGLQGSLAAQLDGSFSFTPNAGFTGTTSFGYTVSDGFGGTDTGTVSIDVVAPTIIHLGDAAGLVTTANPNVWAPFWTDAAVSITHTANLANAGEAWSPVTLNALGSATLAGGDLFGGDLGVSGKNLNTSSANQELQGAEALRFELDSPATKVTVDLTRFFLDDDANTLNYNEAGRLQALDDQGKVVAEATFVANSAAGNQTIVLDHAAGFSAVVISAGAYDSQRDFIFGAHADDAGQFASAPYAEAGKVHGSDFLLDSVEFELAPVIGATVDLWL